MPNSNDSKQHFVIKNMDNEMILDVINNQLPKVARLAAGNNCNDIEYAIREIKVLDDCIEVKFVVLGITNKEFVWYFNNFGI